jgi:hypothetical protein
MTEIVKMIQEMFVASVELPWQLYTYFRNVHTMMQFAKVIEQFKINFLPSE